MCACLFLWQSRNHLSWSWEICFFAVLRVGDFLIAIKFGWPSIHKMITNAQIRASPIVLCYFILQVNSKVCEFGLGPVTMFLNRYKIIDYLPSLFVYDYLVISQKQQQIISLDALYYPVDKYIWCFTISSAIAILLLLAVIQKCWNYASGQNTQSGWLFQGIFSISEWLHWVLYVQL